MELFLESFWPMFRAGLTVSVPLMLVSFALGLVLAFIIALMRMSKLPPHRLGHPWHTSAGTDLRNILWTAVYRHRSQAYSFRYHCLGRQPRCLQL